MPKLRVIFLLNYALCLDLDFLMRQGNRIYNVNQPHYLLVFLYIKQYKTQNHEKLNFWAHGSIFVCLVCFHNKRATSRTPMLA